MGFVKEFREFALKGNVLDLAVGVIIGGAFGGIVSSFIGDVIMPIVSMGGKADFSNLYVPLSETARAAADKASAAGVPLSLADARATGAVLAYGNFIILAFCIFLVVKLFNSARKKFEAEKVAPAPAGPTTDQKLLTEIRDLLAKGR